MGANMRIAENRECPMGTANAVREGSVGFLCSGESPALQGEN